MLLLGKIEVSVQVSERSEMLMQMCQTQWGSHLPCELKPSLHTSGFQTPLLT